MVTRQALLLVVFMLWRVQFAGDGCREKYDLQVTAVSAAMRCYYTAIICHGSACSTLGLGSAVRFRTSHKREGSRGIGKASLTCIPGPLRAVPHPCHAASC